MHKLVSPLVPKKKKKLFLADFTCHINVYHHRRHNPKP
jgi:hypothetical protein